MRGEQTFIETDPASLLEVARSQKAAGARFVQCHAMRDGQGSLDLMYSFSDDECLTLTNYVLHLPKAQANAEDAAASGADGTRPGVAPEDTPEGAQDRAAVGADGAGEPACSGAEPAPGNPSAPSGPSVPSVSELFPNAFMFENEMHDLFGVEVSGISLDYRGGFYHLHVPAPMAVEPQRPARKAPARPASR